MTRPYADGSHAGTPRAAWARSRGGRILVVLAALATSPTAAPGQSSVITFDSANPRDFGSELVGTSGSGNFIIARNDDTVSRMIASLSIGGADASDFMITGGSCGSGTVLAAGSTCSIQVTFSPSMGGTRTAQLSLEHNGGGSPAVLDLQGTGIVPTTTSTSSTTSTTATLPPASHFNCYKAKDLKNPAFTPEIGVTLNDQFADSTVDVKKIFLLCAPADKNGSGINDPATHLCCYKLKSPPLAAPVQAEVADQFGSLQVEVKKSRLLCQPCSKAILP